MSSVYRHLPFAASVTPLQAASYLFGISLFSISFLVFLNSSVSFVVTDLIGQKDGVGDVYVLLRSALAPPPPPGGLC